MLYFRSGNQNTSFGISEEVTSGKGLRDYGSEGLRMWERAGEHKTITRKEGSRRCVEGRVALVA